MDLKVYEYKNCGTCKKALKFLSQNGISYKSIAIRDQPPTIHELRKMLKYYNGDIRKLFNTSGSDYKSLGLKDQLISMSAESAIKMLSENGNLVKRPFVMGDGIGMVGFSESEWSERLLN